MNIPDDISELDLDTDTLGTILTEFAGSMHRFYDALEGIPDRDWYLQTWFTKHLDSTMFDIDISCTECEE